MARQLEQSGRSLASTKGSSNIEKPRKLLVNIACFCLMPNHFHLILEQIQENGISKFMHKLGTGYAKYFNLKNERVGSLFQGTFKAVHIEKDEYLTHLSRYIHLNPVELINPNWKDMGIQDHKEVSKFLENYRWSSYLDYTGKKNFPSVINKKFLMEYFDDENDYKKFINEWLVKDLDQVEDLILEQ